MPATRTLIALIAAAACLGGCSSSQRTGPSPTVPAHSASTGIALDSTGEHHVITFTAPSGGWSFSADRAEEVQGLSNVYVTMRKPNPRFIYPQMLIEHRISTQTASSEPVAIFTRTLEHDEPAGRGGYSQAAQAP